MDYSAFEDIGLSKREIKVYVALLEIGSTTTGEIIKKTNIPSSKIYEVLERLIKKGFVNYIIIKGKKHFQGSPPKHMLNYLKEKENRINEILPSLIAKQDLQKNKQSVEMYEGKKAIFSLLRNLIEDANPGEEYLSFSLGKDHEEEQNILFFKNFTARRKEKKLNVKVLLQQKHVRAWRKSYNNQIMKDVSARHTSLRYPQGFIVFRDKLIIMTLEENPTALVIESKNFSHQYKEFFYQVYDNAKPVL
jgi:HTH-type transcriptional regulator, sugar sensing transcriptional regulator